MMDPSSSKYMLNSYRLQSLFKRPSHIQSVLHEINKLILSYMSWHHWHRSLYCSTVAQLLAYLPSYIVVNPSMQVGHNFHSWLVEVKRYRTNPQNLQVYWFRMW